MPIIVLLLLAAMVATFGFWGTLKGILGAIGSAVLPSGADFLVPRSLAAPALSALRLSPLRIRVGCR